ncbi:MAG: ABC transporter ATP-binding protein [Anaerolineales bacterium]
MPPLLEVNNLTTQFIIPEGTVYAVNGISFYINPGETLAVVGESGCGKSVSMLSVMGLIPCPPGKIVNGEAIYNNQNLLTLKDEEMEKIRGKDIAMVFQDPMTSLNPVLTIGRQITESLICHLDLSASEAKQRAINLLEMVGIPDARNRLEDYPHQFSGGMRQRVMIAMALSCDPHLLIADEPTTALDVTIQAQIVELVIQLKQERNMAVIWITHDLGVVAGMANRVNVMYAGYIVEEASVDELYESPQHPYTRGLLGSLPRVDRRRDSKLVSIPGSPPSLLVKPKGCPFRPRCQFAQEICQNETPSLRRLSAEHQVACWIDLESGAQIRG